MLVSEHPLLSVEWSKNNKISSSQVTCGSERKFLWVCPLLHEYEANVYNRSQGKGCPYCTNRKILAGFNDLATVNPALAAKWHPTKNNGLLPTQVSPASSKKVWWLDDCGHEYQATIANRKNGRGCPYCSNNKVLVGFNDIATRTPERMSEWSKRNEIDPLTVMSSSSTVIEWVCEKGHLWMSTINNRKKGQGCPACCHTFSKLEHRFEELIGVGRFNKKVVWDGNSYKPDFKMSEDLFVNTDGLYWHSVEHKGAGYHSKLREDAVAAGKQMMQFYEDEVLNKSAIVKSMIENKLNLTPNKVDARKCLIAEVPHHEAYSFMASNHLMGPHQQSRAIGLYFESVLVFVLTYRLVLTKNKVEVARMASKVGYLVRGGVSRLMSRLVAVAKDNSIGRIESFCDLRYATGRGYEQLGFRLEGITTGWCWSDGVSRFNRLRCKATVDESGSNISEREHAAKLGWFKIYDAGQAKYIKDVEKL